MQKVEKNLKAKTNSLFIKVIHLLVFLKKFKQLS